MSPRAAPMRPDERRRAIVEAVVPLLLRDGADVTSRQVAQAAGIAEGTVYRVFPDKIALWRAAAEHVTDPDVEVAELREVAAGAADLRSLVVAVAGHLTERSHRVMSVVGVWRVAVLSQYRTDGDAHDRPPAPPAFLVESNRALMGGLAALFAEHADEISVPPETAAAVLRALAIGQRHPAALAETALSPTQVADVLLDGIGRRAAATTDGG